MWAFDPHKIRPGELKHAGNCKENTDDDEEVETVPIGNLDGHDSQQGKKQKHMGDKGGKEHKSHKYLGVDGVIKSKHLRRWVMIDDFSRVVGWRPTGVQKGQQALLTKRLPTEFVQSAVPRVILPCSPEGLPYITEEHKLPCPMLALFNAMRDIRDAGSAVGRAASQMSGMMGNPIQVSWIVVSSYPEWCAYMEAGHHNTDVTSRPHLVETALSYLSWKQSSTIGAAASEDPDHGFTLLMGQSLGKRRLADAKCLINHVGKHALEAVVAFRRQADCVLANLFAESYLMSALFRSLPADAQTNVVRAAVRRVKETPINWKAAPPRARRVTFSIQNFNSLCTLQVEGRKYFDQMTATYPLAIDSVMQFSSLQKRLLVICETSLVERFTAWVQARSASTDYIGVGSYVVELDLLEKALSKTQTEAQALVEDAARRAAAKEEADKQAAAKEEADKQAVARKAADEAAAATQASEVLAGAEKALTQNDPKATEGAEVHESVGNSVERSLKECKSDETVTSCELHTLEETSGAVDQAQAQTLAAVDWKIAEAMQFMSIDTNSAPSVFTTAAGKRVGDGEPILWLHVQPSCRRQDWSHGVRWTNPLPDITNAQDQDAFIAMLGRDPTMCVKARACINATPALRNWTISDNLIPVIQSKASKIFVEYCLTAWGPQAEPVNVQVIQNVPVQVPSRLVPYRCSCGDAADCPVLQRFQEGLLPAPKDVAEKPPTELEEEAAITTTTTTTPPPPTTTTTST